MKRGGSIEAVEGVVEVVKGLESVDAEIECRLSAWYNLVSIGPIFVGFEGVVEMADGQKHS